MYEMRLKFKIRSKFIEILLKLQVRSTFDIRSKLKIKFKFEFRSKFEIRQIKIAKLDQNLESLIKIFKIRSKYVI